MLKDFLLQIPKAICYICYFGQFIVQKEFTKLCLKSQQFSALQLKLGGISETKNTFLELI